VQALQVAGSCTRGSQRLYARSKRAARRTPTSSRAHGGRRSRSAARPAVMHTRAQPRETADSGLAPHGDVAHGPAGSARRVGGSGWQRRRRGAALRIPKRAHAAAVILMLCGFHAAPASAAGASQQPTAAAFLSTSGLSACCRGATASRVPCTLDTRLMPCMPILSCTMTAARTSAHGL